MVKTLKNLLLQNQKSYDLETWHVASRTQGLQSLYRKIFYGKVKFGNIGFSIGKSDIRITCPCNEHPLTPHFYVVKLGFTGVYIFFLFLL